jgi:hypothetical protein
MTAIALSARQTRISEITNLCLLLFTMGAGLFFTIMRWKLDGAALIVVCVLIFNYVTLLRSQLGQASARIEELEKKLSTSTDLPNV